jgi:hypothetical protein
MSGQTTSTNIPPPPPPANAAPPGVKLPTVLPLTTGTSTPGQSAYQAGINQSDTQNKLNQALSGGSSSSYTVPQFNMMYNSNMGPGQTPNNIIQSSVLNAGQTTANAQYDTCVGQTNCSGSLGVTGQAGQTGGFKNNVVHSGQINGWGCYSGGKNKRKSKRNYNSKKKVKSKSKGKSRKNVLKRRIVTYFKHRRSSNKKKRTSYKK